MKSDRVISIGASTRWPYSWTMVQVLHGRLRILEVVILGYGFRIRALRSSGGKPKWGMAATKVEIEFYLKFRPHNSSKTTAEAA